MPIRVVIVDDSDIARAMLREVLEQQGDIRVVGEARDGRSALELVGQVRPDLATVDLGMPGMGGLELIEELMASTPLPILVVTAQVSSPDEDRVFDAIRRGALEVAPKPRGSAQGAELRAKVRTLAAIPVLPHVRSGRGGRAPGPGTAADRAVTARGTTRPALVAIAASAGGPPALTRLLRALPASFDAAIAIVQHLPGGYADRFARELGEHCALPVATVHEATAVEPGRVLVAPGDRHLVATAYGTLAPSDEPAVRGHRPAASVLFESLAQRYGRAAAGVVLTGMGDDGAAGLLELKRRGALTIAQDEASSAVYGMPRAAVELGAATQVASLDEIADLLVYAVRAR